jgi:hypothetical protein
MYGANKRGTFGVSSPLARRDGDLPLLKPFTGVILASGYRANVG